MTKENFMIKESKLLEFYKLKLELPILDDVVLLVIGGEFGIIADYLIKNTKAPVIIFIEPHKQFMNNSEGLKKIKTLKNQTKVNLEWVTVKELEKNQNVLLNLLIKYNIFEKGLEVIKNPFYSETFPEIIEFETQRLTKFLNSIKYTKKGLETKYFNYLNDQYLSQLSHLTKINKKEIGKVFKNNAEIKKDGSLVILIGNEYGFYAKELLEKEKVFNLILIEPKKEFCSFDIKKNFSDIETLSANHIKAFFADKKKKAIMLIFLIM